MSITPKAGKADIDLVDHAATRSSMAAEMVRDVPLLLFSMGMPALQSLKQSTRRLWKIWKVNAI